MKKGMPENCSSEVMAIDRFVISSRIQLQFGHEDAVQCKIIHENGGGRVQSSARRCCRCKVNFQTSQREEVASHSSLRLPFSALTMTNAIPGLMTPQLIANTMQRYISSLNIDPRCENGVQDIVSFIQCRAGGLSS